MLSYGMDARTMSWLDQIRKPRDFKVGLENLRQMFALVLVNRPCTVFHFHDQRKLYPHHRAEV